MEAIELSNFKVLPTRKQLALTDEQLDGYISELEDYLLSLEYDSNMVAKNEKHYLILSKIFYALITLKRTKLLNSDRLPEKPDDKGYLIVCNHIGSFDQFYLTKALLDWAIHYVVKTKVTTWPIRWNLIYKPTGVLIIDESSLRSMNEVKKQASQYIMHGTNVMIFPEGTRRGEDNFGQFGILPAQVANDTGCGVITLALKNVQKVFSPEQPVVNVGPTLNISKREDIRDFNERMRNQVHDNYNEILAYEYTKKRKR